MMHNALRRVAADFAWAVWRGGGEVLIENPADRNDESMPHVHWAARAGHACVFDTEELVAFQKASKAERITAPFCSFGAPVQKYLSSLCWRRRGPLQCWRLSTALCAHMHGTRLTRMARMRRVDGR